MSDRAHRESFYEQCGLVTCREAKEILERFENSHWQRRSGVAPAGYSLGEQARISIPANPARDDDFRMGAFIARVEKLERELADARAAVGKAWFVGDVTLAKAISRKCAALENAVRSS